MSKRCLSEQTKLTPYVVKASTMLQVTRNMRSATFSVAVCYAPSSMPKHCRAMAALTHARPHDSKRTPFLEGNRLARRMNATTSAKVRMQSAFSAVTMVHLLSFIPTHI